MLLKFKIVLVALCVIPLSILAQDQMPINDTVRLTMAHVEGRWVEEKDDEKNSIYLFKNDSTFFKAIDNQDVLIFNVSGLFKLYNDTIRVVYQDMSRMHVAKPRVRTMYLKVIALSDEELNIYKTDRNETSFMRLRRQTNPQ